MELIPVGDLEPRRLYRIRSRNLAVGVWDPVVQGFIGIRKKFGFEYLFTEYHWDYSTVFGTVRQMEPMEHVVPDHVDIVEGWSTCEKCNQQTEWVQTPPSLRTGTWHHIARGLDDNHKVSPMHVQNSGLFDWMKPFHDAETETRPDEAKPEEPR